MPWSGSVVSTSGVLETNFFGYVHGARAVLPHFRDQGHGVLINNASAYSHVGVPWLTACVSGKFAVPASALHPKRERIVGGAGRLVTVAEAVAPGRFERVNRRYVNGLQFAAEPAPATDGNLYDRAEARGGWRRRPDPPPQLRRLAAVGLLAAGSVTIARIVTRSGRT